MLNALLSLVRGVPAKPAAKRSPHWPSVRAAHLRIEPECAACGGTDALEVHHVQDFHEHPELELDASNLLTLCEKPSHNCHFTFGHFWNWKLINPSVRADAAAWLAKAQKSRAA